MNESWESLGCSEFFRSLQPGVALNITESTRKQMLSLAQRELELHPPPTKLSAGEIVDAFIERLPRIEKLPPNLKSGSEQLLEAVQEPVLKVFMIGLKETIMKVSWKVGLFVDLDPADVYAEMTEDEFWNDAKHVARLVQQRFQTDYSVSSITSAATCRLFADPSPSKGQKTAERYLSQAPHQGPFWRLFIVHLVRELDKRKTAAKRHPSPQLQVTKDGQIDDPPDPRSLT